MANISTFPGATVSGNGTQLQNPNKNGLSKLSTGIRVASTVAVPAVPVPPQEQSKSLPETEQQLNTTTSSAMLKTPGVNGSRD